MAKAKKSSEQGQKKWAFVGVELHSEEDSDLIISCVSDEEAEKQVVKSPVKKSKDRDLREQAADVLHLDDNDDPCITRNMVLATLINAGLGEIYNGSTHVSTKDGTKINEFLRIFGKDFPLKDLEKQAAAAWKARAEMIDRGGGKGGAPVVRPVFERWRIRVAFRYDSSLYSEERVRHLWDKAGFGCGYGANRKLCHGRWEVAVWQVFKTPEEAKEWASWKGTATKRRSRNEKT